MTPASGPPPVGLFVGLATFDLIQLVDRRPGPNEKIRAERQLVVGGGPAANAAVTFGALGGRADLHTRLGSSDVAGFVRAEIAGRGVGVNDWSPQETREPPAAAITVDGGTGDRAVVSTHGQLADENPSAPPQVAVADVVLLDGHYPAIAAAVLAAVGSGAVVVLDGGSFKPGLEPLLPAVEVAILSDDFRVPGDGEPADYLLACGVSGVVTTHGPDPITWTDGTGAGTVAVPAVRTVDTLGAGDVFHGAACYYLAAGQRLPDALAMAAEVAALCVTSFGTRDWLDQLP